MRLLNALVLFFLFAVPLSAQQKEESASAKETYHFLLALDDEALEELTAALHADSWSKLRAFYPGLDQGENPMLQHPDYNITLGELVILTRAWDCLKNMLRCGLCANESMIEMAGHLGNEKTYSQLVESNPIVTPEQVLHFTGKMLQLALKHGGNPNAASLGEQRRPLMVQKKASDIQTLIQHGADLDALDAKGRSAIFYHDNPEIVQLLIKMGANVHIIDKMGHSARDYWQENQKRQEILEKAGCPTVKPMELTSMARYGDYEVIMNDLDDYGYIIINEKKEDSFTDKPVFYFASRFPTPRVRQTEDWEEFLSFLQDMPEHSTIHRYVRCQHHFSHEEEWQQGHSLDDFLRGKNLYEGEERVFCVCEGDELDVEKE